jgi:hypothetical protein
MVWSWTRKRMKGWYTVELEKENERMVWSWKRRMKGWYGAGLERE